MRHFDEGSFEIYTRRLVGRDDTGLISVASRLVLRSNNGNTARVRAQENDLGMVFTKIDTVEGRLHKMLQSDCLASSTMVAKQLTFADKTALSEFIKSAEEFFTRRKGRDTDG